MSRNYPLVTLLVLGLVIEISGCDQKNRDVEIATQPLCIDSQSHCMLTTGAGNVRVSFNQAHLVAEYPFQLFVTLPNDSLTIRRGFMEGVDMFMGKIPLFFSPTKEQEARTYSAEAMFGSCSESAMQWRIWLEIISKESPDKVIQTLSFTVTSYQSINAVSAN